MPGHSPLMHQVVGELAQQHLVRIVQHRRFTGAHHAQLDQVAQQVPQRTPRGAPPIPRRAGNLSNERIHPARAQLVWLDAFGGQPPAELCHHNKTPKHRRGTVAQLYQPILKTAPERLKRATHHHHGLIHHHHRLLRRTPTDRRGGSLDQPPGLCRAAQRPQAQIPLLDRASRVRRIAARHKRALGIARQRPQEPNHTPGPTDRTRPQDVHHRTAKSH